MKKVDKVPDDAVAIDGYPGYFICRNGDVYSDKDRGFCYSGAIKLKVCKSGWKGAYHCVYLFRNGLRATKFIHRLLAITFIDKPLNKNYGIVRHLDDIKVNNTLTNLAWGTQKDNMADRILNGNSNKGEKHGMSKLTRFDVWAIRRLDEIEGIRQHQIATVFGVCQQTISLIVTKKYWKHI